MLTTRMANGADAELIAQQRLRMFADAGRGDDITLQTMAENFVAWVRPRLLDGSYVGWLVEDEGHAIAGAGLWLMEFPPHWMDAEPCRAYLLNFYTAPEYRGQGIAPRLLKLAKDDAWGRGIKVISLHASKFGKPIYARDGFVQTDEMIARAAGAE